jgi:hypothetical protein
MISVGDVFRCDGLAYRVTAIENQKAMAERDDALDPMAFKSIQFFAPEAVEAAADEYGDLLDAEGFAKSGTGYDPTWLVMRKSALLTKFANDTGSFWYLPSRHLGRP